MDIFLKKIIGLFLVLSITLSNLSGCGVKSTHLEMSYEDNENSDIVLWDDVNSSTTTTWNDVPIVTWNDVDEYSNWVYSELLFNEITEDMPIVECRVLDYSSNGQYFDGEQVYSMVGDRFDVNSFVAKYAVGTGVILICVVLNVATAGGTTPVTCFIAGAADASVKMATRGAAFGAATKAIITAIKSDGNFEDSLYGALEGSADGYMWGAIYGAITGGFNSKFCFAMDTPVYTQNGMKPIQTVEVGDMVYSYDYLAGNYAFMPVTQIICGESQDMIRVSVGEEIIESTFSHPFLTEDGWARAENLTIGMKLLSTDNCFRSVYGLSRVRYEESIKTYSLCVDNYHSFLIGENKLVVHNRCKPNEKYANDTYKFPEGSQQALKYPNGVPFDANGYPDFSQYATKSVTFDYPSLEGKATGKCLSGNCGTDFRLANQAVGLQSTPAGYTWHHCQDMRTMQLVPQDIHSVAFGGVAHAGGEALLEEFWAALVSASL